jgi:flagellar hook-basal body complex protein FliE
MIIPPTAVPTPAAAPSIQGAGQRAGGADGVFGSALDSVTESLAEADNLSQQVATGEITDLSQLTAASAKAELALELTVAFRDRAVQSFQQIMQMQV